MSRRQLAITLSIALCLPAAAQAFEPVTDRAEFLRLVDGRKLKLGLFGVGLSVLADGRIEGEALGWPVSGTWVWQQGYFCREMDWSGREIPYNCQLVEAEGDKIRFTTDRGAGDSAAFRLQ